MPKNWTIRSAAAAISLAGLWIAYTQQAPADLTIEKVAEGLHVIVGSGGNVAVYNTPEGVILVDDKFDQNHAQILAKVKTVTDKPIRYVLNTHQHGDHTGGNLKLLQENAEILIQKNARANMVKGSMPGIPRIVYNDEASVFLGDKEVQAHHYGRGHTNGDTVILFPALRVLHTGDLFVDGAPFIDYSAGGSGMAWTDTLTAAMKLDFDTVIPGHGPVMKRADLEQWIAAFSAVKQRLTDLKRQGRSKDEAAQLLKLDAPHWKPSGNWSQRSFPGLYDELK